MKIILIQDCSNLGKTGKILEVKTGYARNFLFPQKIAILATEKNINQLKLIKEKKEKQLQDEREKLKILSDKLSKHSINISVKTGETGKLFGVVTKEDIITAINAVSDIKISKEDIVLEEGIKETGVFTVETILKSEKFPEITTTTKIKVWIVGDKNA